MGQLVKVCSEVITAILTFLKLAFVLQVWEYSKTELLFSAASHLPSVMQTHSQVQSYK